MICCQQKSGALLRTSGKREYIHVVCAYWNPKIMKLTESPVIMFDPRLLSRKVKNIDLNNIKGCTICGISTGLTVECSRAGCSREFHVTCALDTKILERTVKEFCNPDKLECPKHYAVMAKENLAIYREKVKNDRRLSSTNNLTQNNPIGQVGSFDALLNSTVKRSPTEKIEQSVRKLFKPEKGGTFEWLAEKIVVIQNTVEQLSKLSPEFKGMLYKIDL